MIFEISKKVKISEAPIVFTDKIKIYLTLDNPKYIENKIRGRYNGKTPKTLEFYSVIDDSLIIPIGSVIYAITLAQDTGLIIDFKDNRRVMPEKDLTFKGTLRDYQQLAVTDMLKRQFGILEAPTGSGKTTIALALIAERKQPTLIIVHNKELLNQWLKRIQQFLGIDSTEVGIIGDGKFSIGKRITIGMVQSVYKRVNDIHKHFGMLVVDECHHAPSRTFTEAVTAFDCKFKLGLTATPFRRDKLDSLLAWYIGPVMHKMDRQKLIDKGSITSFDVVWRETEFWTETDAVEKYSTVISELTKDTPRNTLIVDDIQREVDNGATCIVMSDRKTHCKEIHRLLRLKGIRAGILTGDNKADDRVQTVTNIQNGSLRVLVATSQLVGEGFDCPGLDTLFLTTPVKFSGRLLQMVGRVLRPCGGKSKATVYDYVDTEIGVLLSSSYHRRKTYNKAA